MKQPKSPQEKISEILREAKWSQEELARRLDVSFKALNAWANGKAEPHAQNLQKIDALYFDVVGRETVGQELLNETISKALSTYISIDELINNQEILKTTTLYLTYHTNTIEGSTMTLADVEEVLDDEDAIIPDKTVREQIEARNHRAAFNFLLLELKKQGKNFKWSSELIKNTHLRLMNGVMGGAGQFRNYGVRIMGSRTPLSNWVSVPDKVEQLVKYLNSSDDDLIKSLAVAHARFEQIHPFGDGNGRTGRLIMFIQALKAGVVPPLVIKERKHAYYKYLEIAQLKEEYELLELFIAESILFTDGLLGG